MNASKSGGLCGLMQADALINSCLPSSPATIRMSAILLDLDKMKLKVAFGLHE
jgi:hypothetical protein